MFTHMEAVPDVSANVLEPVAEQVVRYIIDQIGFLNIFENNIMFEGTNETTSHTIDEEGNRKLFKGNKLICTVNNIISPTETPWDGMNNTFITSEGYPLSRLRNRYPVFSDIINKLFLFTMERPTSISIDCQFNFEDRTDAYELGNRMFSQFSNGQTIAVPDIMFEYPIHNRMLNSMFTLFNMTKFAENPLNKFILYLRDGSHNQITVKKHRIKKDVGQIVIQKTIINCLVKIDFSDANVNPEKKNKLPIKFTNQMNLIVQFMKPDDLIWQFPPVINNKPVPGYLIPDHEIPPKPPESIYPDIPTNTWIQDENKKWEDWALEKDNNIVRVPPWDNWYPPHTDSFPGKPYKPIAIVIIEITGPPWETWLHLDNEIQPATKVSSQVIQYIKFNKNQVFYKGLPVLIVVYRDDEILDQSHLRIDGDYLVIKSDQIHKIHRVVIYVETFKQDGKVQQNHFVTLFEIIVERK